MTARLATSSPCRMTSLTVSRVQIEPHLLAAEGVRAMARSADDLGAWELVARAQTHFWRMTRADFETAIGPLKRAVAAYPDYAPARGMLGLRLAFASHMGWVARDEGLRAGPRACAACDRAGRSRSMGSQRARLLGDDGAAYRGVGLSLSPGGQSQSEFCGGATNLSHIFAFAGQDREAIAHGEEAMRLSPLDPEMAFFLGGIAIAHYMAGRFSEAARSATEALRLRPGFQGAQRLRAASLAQAGQIDAARA